MNLAEAKSIYEAMNWDMLEAEMESGYDRGGFRELVDMYPKLVDEIERLQTKMEIDAAFAKVVLAERNLAWHQLESQQRELDEFRRWSKKARTVELLEQLESQDKQLESQKAITELAVKASEEKDAEIKRLEGLFREIGGMNRDDVNWFSLLPILRKSKVERTP